MRIFRPDHPLAAKDGMVLVHRMKAWDAGLITDRHDHVHHKNGDKTDNRLSNLEVKSESTHHRDHVRETGFVVNQYGVWPLRKV